MLLSPNEASDDMDASSFAASAGSSSRRGFAYGTRNCWVSFALPVGMARIPSALVEPDDPVVRDPIAEPFPHFTIGGIAGGLVFCMGGATEVAGADVKAGPVGGGW